MAMDKIEEMAHHEIGWWKAHHRREKGKLISEMTELHVLMFGISPEESRTIVQHRIEAARCHDEAERLEDQGYESDARIW